MARPLIALDFSDCRDSGPGGQFRYAGDLLEGLDRLQPDADFVKLAPAGSHGGRFADFDHRSGRWTTVSVDEFKGPGAYYRRQLALAGTLARNRARLVHAVCEGVPWLAPCPIVATAYDLMYEMFPEYKVAVETRSYRLNRWGVRRRARRVICISRSTADDVHERWAVPVEQLDVVPLGTAFGLYGSESDGALLPEWLRRLSDPVIVSPYNLEPRKNLAVLCECAALLRRRYESLTLVLFGRAALSSEREATFEALLRQLNLLDVVVRPGVLDDRTLAALYRRGTVFAFPSLYEGFGLPVLEAMACGACVVARGISAMSEVVGKAGLLLETADPATLAAGIGQLFDDSSSRARLSAAGRERAAAFTIERMARLTFASYEAALHKRVPLHALSEQVGGG